MAGGSREQVLGVLTSLRAGLTDYDLIFTDSRIVAAKVGSSGLAQAAGGLVGLAISRSGQDSKRDEYVGLSVDQILGAHKRNFAISYAGVERGVFSAGINMVTLPSLTLWVAGEKFKFILAKSVWKKDAAQVAQARALLERVLGARMQFDRM